MRPTSWRRWLFLVRSLPARLRFRAGRASFVECLVSRTSNELVPVLDPAGRPLGPRLLARHDLTSHPPRSGAAGWRLYVERLADPGPHRFARLECAHCGHQFVFQIQAALDPLAPPGGGRPTPAAEYRGSWFHFAPSAFDQPPGLSCPRCECRTRPGLVHLHEP